MAQSRYGCIMFRLRATLFVLLPASERLCRMHYKRYPQFDFLQLHGELFRPRNPAYRSAMHSSCAESLSRRSDGHVFACVRSWFILLLFKKKCMQIRSACCLDVSPKGKGEMQPGCRRLLLPLIFSIANGFLVVDLRSWKILEDRC